jgi:hypothetical protein
VSPATRISIEMTKLASKKKNVTQVLMQIKILENAKTVNFLTARSALIRILVPCALKASL